MATISNILAREILDSRGNPTVEAEVQLSEGVSGHASIPSGASTGAHEAVELRDGGRHFGGKDVTHAIHNIETIIKPEILKRPLTQQTLDSALIALDGTENKSKLGANALLAVSLAFAHAEAENKKLPLWKHLSQEAGTTPRLPTPMMNILNGGKHAVEGADIQEFMLVPIGRNIAEALRMGSEIYHALEQLLSNREQSTLTGDEGGFAPNLSSNEEALGLLGEASITAGYTPGPDVCIGIDAAATSFFNGSAYVFSTDKRQLSADELLKLYEDWAGRFPLFSIEDGFFEDDWDHFTRLTLALGKKIKIVGDDLFVTNIKRLEEGIAKRAANSIIIKPNQVGTLTETIAVTRSAQKAGFTCIASHRSGETEDTSIAHLAVGLGMEFIKAGAPASGERVAKYNELLRIAEQLP